jgi:Flp pilus assembly protein TadD
MCRKLTLAATGLIGAALSLAASGSSQAAGATAFAQVSTSPAVPAPAAMTGQSTSVQAAKPSAPAQRPPRRKATAEERADAERLSPLARAAFWARESDVDPTDQVAAVRLAAALRAMGQYAEAASNAERVLVMAPDNIDALMEQARAYVGQGQGFYAIAPAQHVRALAPKDWRPLSILGVAYAQVRRHDDALAAWRQALDLSPDNPAVLANMAMELAATGDAPQAETLLRRAAGQPGASLTVRQDLTLVLGLQGKLAEAERRLREDLPPEQADADLDYLKAVSVGGGQATPVAAPAQPARSWDSVKSSGG